MSNFSELEKVIIEEARRHVQRCGPSALSIYVAKLNRAYLDASAPLAQEGQCEVRTTTQCTDCGVISMVGEVHIAACPRVARLSIRSKPPQGPPNIKIGSTLRDKEVRWAIMVSLGAIAVAVFIYFATKG